MSLRRTGRLKKAAQPFVTGGDDSGNANLNNDLPRLLFNLAGEDSAPGSQVNPMDEDLDFGELTIHPSVPSPALAETGGPADGYTTHNIYVRRR